MVYLLWVVNHSNQAGGNSSGYHLSSPRKMVGVTMDVDIAASWSLVREPFVVRYVEEHRPLEEMGRVSKEDLSLLLRDVPQ